MKVNYKAAVKEKEFAFQDGDDIKIIATSFLYATEDRPELVYEGKLLATESDGFWAVLTSSTQSFSKLARQPGITKQIESDKEEFFAFTDIEDVLRPDEEYPNRKDPLIRFALDGPSE